MPFSLPILVTIANIAVFLGWTIAYLFMAYDGNKKFVANAPLGVLAPMIAYEISATMVWPVIDDNLAFGLFEWLWLGIDLYLLFQLFIFPTGADHTFKKFLASIAVLAFTILITVNAIDEFHLEDMGLPGIIFGTIIAGAFLPFALKHPRPEDLSRRSHVARAIGDLGIAGSVWLAFPFEAEGSLNNLFTFALLMTMIVCDLWTMTVIFARQRGW